MNSGDVGMTLQTSVLQPGRIWYLRPAFILPKLCCALLVLVLLAAATRAGAVDTYDPTTQQLTIPSLRIGAATYLDVVVGIAGVVSGPSGTSATGSADLYDSATGELTIPEVLVGSTPYYNVVAAIRYLASIGSVSGADVYSGGVLTVPTLQQGNTLYSVVKMTVPAANVIGISGGMPAAIRDQFDPVANVLIIPVVQVGSRIYTNVAVSAGNGNILSVGSKAPIVVAGASPSFIVGSTAVSVAASPTAGEPTANVSFAINNYPASGVYYGYVAVGGAVTGVSFSFDSTLGPNGVRNGSVQLQFDLPYLQGSGTYASTVTLLICLDSQCRSPVAGSPQTIVVTYTVSGNEVPQAVWNISPSTLGLESVPTGPALSTTLNVTGLNLPPYGAYLFVRQSRSGIIQNISYDNLTETTGYVNGTITLNLVSPAELGPGVYSDVLTVQVCYDVSCAQQAVGSPWTIPLSYSVDAVAGSQFQVRALPFAASAIAGDSLGKYLYIGTSEPSAQNQYNLVVLDPATGSTLGTVVMPGQVQQVVVSGDGSFAYVSVNILTDGQARIERVDLATMAIDEEISFNQTDSQISDVSISPVSSHTIGVALDFAEIGTDTRVVEVLDDAVPRQGIYSAPDTNGTGLTYLQWSTDGTGIYIVGGGFSEDSALLESSVSAAGLAPTTTLLQTAYGDGVVGRLHSIGGLLYFDGGAVVDPSTGALVGQYVLITPSTGDSWPPINSAVLPDPTTGKAFAVFADTPGIAGGSQTVESFSLAQYEPLEIARTSVAIASPVRWGPDGLAFMNAVDDNEQNYIYLINGPFVGASGANGAGQARPNDTQAPPEAATFIIKRAP